MLAKIGADTAENERFFAENLPRTGNYPTGPPPGGPAVHGVDGFQAALTGMERTVKERMEEVSQAC